MNNFNFVQSPKKNGCHSSVFFSSHSLTHSRTNAFTLVEILIILSIIGILATIFVPTWKEYNQQSKLEFSKNIMVSTLSKNFSKSRSLPKIFGVSAESKSNQIKTFECEYKFQTPDICDKKNETIINLQTGVLIKDKDRKSVV